jgi:tRNA threonylcarbamoyladenosine biosynthesis protein TsaE
MKSVTLDIATEADMEALGGRLVSALGNLKLVTLNGPLGAGKTTLVRGLLRALGHAGAVKSPTFTLVEPYELNNRRFFHFDLYRLKDSEELEFLGIRDYLAGPDLCVVEWAERAKGLLPAPDVAVMIAPANHGRSVTVTAHTPRGEAWLGGF